MKLSTARIAVYGCMGATVLFGLIAMSGSGLFMGLMLAAVTAEIIIFFVYIRCPHCGRHLDRTGMRDDIRICPFCGKELEPGDGSGKELEPGDGSAKKLE